MSDARSDLDRRNEDRQKLEEDLSCPILGSVFENPVALLPSGHTVEMSAAEALIDRNQGYPAADNKVKSYIPNRTIKQIIEVLNRSRLDQKDGWLELEKTLTCPNTKTIMLNPVLILPLGDTVEKSYAEELKSNGRIKDFISNYAVRAVIDTYLMINPEAKLKQYGAPREQYYDQLIGEKRIPEIDEIEGDEQQLEGVVRPIIRAQRAPSDDVQAAQLPLAIMIDSNPLNYPEDGSAPKCDGGLIGKTEEKKKFMMDLSENGQNYGYQISFAMHKIKVGNINFNIQDVPGQERFRTFSMNMFKGHRFFFIFGDNLDEVESLAKKMGDYSNFNLYGLNYSRPEGSNDLEVHLCQFDSRDHSPTYVASPSQLTDITKTLLANISALWLRMQHHQAINQQEQVVEDPNPHPKKPDCNIM